MNFPESLKYTDDHEWLKVEADGTASVGITDYAQSELGDIVYVEVDMDEGDEVEKGEEFGVVEAVKTTSALLMPVTGEILEINPKLEDDPDLINSSPYDEGWIIKIKLTDASQTEELMSSEEYKALVKEAS